MWDISDPCHAEESTLKYCGLEIQDTGLGLKVCQKQYVEELLQRHPQILSSCPTPCCNWREAIDDGISRDENPQLATIRKAQSLTGELLWLVVRARPELGFAVSRMAQLCARRPEDSILIGEGVLRYLRGTTDQGLLLASCWASSALS